MLDASLRGRLKREARTGDKVVIGDRVEVATRPDGSSTIEAVGSRDSQVVRRGPGGRRAKVVAANVDRLVVVAAAARPEPRQVLLDRLLVVGESNHLELALVMNKMRSGRDGRHSQAAFGPLQNGSGTGFWKPAPSRARAWQSSEDLLCIGHLGSGGTVRGGEIQPAECHPTRIWVSETGELSHKKGRGRHTTVSARLIPLDCGGLVADTPGFSDVGVWGVDQRTLEGCFPEFHPFREECQLQGMHPPP